MTPAPQASASTGGSENSKTMRGLNDAIRHQIGNRVFLACVIVNSADAEKLLSIIEKFTETADETDANILPTERIRVTPNEPEDSWLEHKEAATYLGIATSTLYRYAAQQQIEYRKLGGRLQYRRSILDKFTARMVRPARHPIGSRSIIIPALSSGK
jgi:excisionase family DNA binding protein